jgi:hypothetical protein
MSVAMLVASQFRRAAYLYEADAVVQASDIGMKALPECRLSPLFDGNGDGVDRFSKCISQLDRWPEERQRLAEKYCSMYLASSLAPPGRPRENAPSITATNR